MSTDFPIVLPLSATINGTFDAFVTTVNDYGYLAVLFELPRRVVVRRGPQRRRGRERRSLHRRTDFLLRFSRLPSAVSTHAKGRPRFFRRED